MGRLAELFEKKASGAITEAELKEFEQLKKEAQALTAEEDNTNEDVDKKEEDVVDTNDDAEVEKLAQKFADSVSGKLGSMTDRLEKVLGGIDKHEVTSVADKSGGYIFDKKLGKKLTVNELTAQKLVLGERKAAGKSVTEVSMRSFEFVKAFLDRNVEKLQILSEGTAADGGYLVPEEFANLIIEDIRDINIMRQIAAPAIPINGDTFHIPGLASRPKAAWRNEKAAKNTSTANFSENVLTPYSLAAIVPLSNELVADASLGVAGSIVNYVAGLLATALSEKEEEAFWTGNGSGKPSGVDSSVYTLRTVAAGSTDSSRSDSVVQAFYRTPQGYRNRGVWVGNSATWEKVSNLKDDNGNFLLTSLANAPTQTLKGRPIYESNYLAGGTLLYGDFSFYQIVDREGLSIRVSDEATVAGTSAFENNLTYVRAEKRVDGELLLPAAITKVTGLGSA